MANDNIDKFDDILDAAGVEMIGVEDMPNSLRRSIWLIQDEADNETYTADEILDDKTQDIIFDIRHSLYAAYKSGQYKYVCKQCQQPLGLKVRTHEGDFFPFFSHFQNSGLCPLKNQFIIDPTHSVHEKEREFRASSLYLLMVERLQEVLKRSNKFDNIEENKIINKPEIKGYRRPAIYSTCQEKEICFDLLVSNPLISLLVGRNAFYKLHKMFYFWIFPSFTTEHQRLCQKDILYMNRRNVFVFDSKDFYSQRNRDFCGDNTNSSSHVYAYEESIRQNKLMFNCYWQTPEVSEINGKNYISIKWNGPKLVAFEDLSFDSENCELYYHDSDIDFYNSYPEEIQRQIDEWIKIKKDRWFKIFDSIEKRKIQYAQLMAKRERKERLKYYYSLIEDGEGEPEVFYDEESKLYGYKINDFDIIPPTYYDAKPFYNGYAWVRKKGRWGVIDLYNRKVANFQFSSLHELEDGLYYIHKHQKYILVNYLGIQLGYISFDSIKILKTGLYKVGNIVVTGYDRGYLPGTGFYNYKMTKTLWGIINNKGEEVLPCKFDSIGSFEDGKAKVTINYKTGYIDENGREDYEINDRGDVIVFKSPLMGKYGLMDKESKILVQATYDDIGAFCDGLAVVRRYGAYGIIQNDGTLITDGVHYSNVNVLFNGVFSTYKDGKYSLHNTNNKSFKLDFDKIGEFNERYISVSKQAKWGVVDYEGKIIIPFEYGEILELKEDRLIVKNNDHIAEIDWNGNEIYIVQSEGIINIYQSRLLCKYGLMDIDSNPITGLDYSHIKRFNDRLFIAFKDGKCGLIDNMGNTMLAFEYNTIEIINDEYTKIKKDGLWGLLNARGEFILKPEFYEIVDVKEGIIKVKKGAYDKIGEFDLNGQEIYSHRNFDDVIVYESIVQKKCGLMDCGFNPITDLLYEDIKNFKDGKAKAKHGLYWGVIDINGNTIIPFEFSEIGDFVDGYASAKIYGKGIIDERGNEIYNYHQLEDLVVYESRLLNKFGLMTLDKEPITGLIYDCYPKFKNGVALVSKDKKWGTINKNGENAIPFLYDKLIETQNNTYIVKNNKGYGIIDNMGNILTPTKYDRVLEKSKGIYCIREEFYGYWGVIDDSNNTILAIKYDAIGVFADGFLNVKKGRWWKKIKIRNNIQSIPKQNIIDLSQLEEGVIYEVVSTSIKRFGVFIEIPNIGCGLIPAKQILQSNKKLNDFKVGTPIKVLLLRKDTENNRATFKLSD